jgi:hypothetical protein
MARARRTSVGVGSPSARRNQSSPSSIRFVAIQKGSSEVANRSASSSRPLSRSQIIASRMSSYWRSNRSMAEASSPRRIARRASMAASSSAVAVLASTLPIIRAGVAGRKRPVPLGTVSVPR